MRQKLGWCNSMHINGNSNYCEIGPTVAKPTPKMLLDRKAMGSPPLGRYFPPSTNFAIVASCMFEVPS